jgi:SPP1 family predicted phage head-tail adaptor
VSPRRQVLGKPSTPIFTEAAKEYSREIAHTDTITIWREERKSDEGGDSTVTWVNKGTVSGRLDAAGHTGRGVTAAAISEEATHVITMAPNADVKDTDKLEVGGVKYDIVTLMRHTGQMSIMAEVRA